jgi:DNA polymerase sigma
MSVFKKALRDFVSTNPGISIDEQIHGLTTILQITKEEQHQQSQIISSLEEWLSLEFPSCRFHLLGSSVSGLAFHMDTDLDISLETSQSNYL